MRLGAATCSVRTTSRLFGVLGLSVKKALWEPSTITKTPEAKSAVLKYPPTPSSQNTYSGIGKLGSKSIEKSKEIHLILPSRENFC